MTSKINKMPFYYINKRKVELLGDEEFENQLKIAVGLKKYFDTVFSKDSNGGLGDKAG